MENTSNMTFREKKKHIAFTNNIGILRNLEIKFHDENYCNYNNITVIYYVSASHWFLIILHKFM